MGQHATLIDIRFKLLAFVPTVTAIAVAAVGDHDNSGFPIADFGFLVTLGVIMYEVRNSELHDDYARRVQELEERLVVKLRPVKQERTSTFGITAKHQYALALIYGSCVGAWVALALFSGAQYMRGGDASATGTPGWLMASVHWLSYLPASRPVHG